MSNRKKMIIDALNRAIGAIEAMGDDEYDTCLDAGVSPQEIQAGLASIRETLEHA